MIRSIDRRLLGVVLAGTVALTLAACGRKGPLDPPPSASIAPPAQTERQPTLGEPTDPFSGAFGRTPEPATAPKPGNVPQKSSFFLDWLLK